MPTEFIIALNDSLEPFNLESSEVVCHMANVDLSITNCGQHPNAANMVAIRYANQQVQISPMESCCPAYDEKIRSVTNQWLMEMQRRKLDMVWRYPEQFDIDSMLGRE